VAAHARNQSFQGMDFAQADMALVKFGMDYKCSMFENTDTGYILELTPKDGSDAGYGKLILSIGKGRFEVKQIEYYAKDGKEKLKTEVRSDWKLYEGKHYNASTLTVTSAKENHQTIMKNSDYVFDQGLPDKYFTTRSLKKPLR
jgi:outer membrane lipoprotein-sorting protein